MKKITAKVGEFEVSTVQSVKGVLVEIERYGQPWTLLNGQQFSDIIDCLGSFYKKVTEENERQIPDQNTKGKDNVSG